MLKHLSYIYHIIFIIYLGYLPSNTEETSSVAIISAFNTVKEEGIQSVLYEKMH